MKRLFLPGVAAAGFVALAGVLPFMTAYVLAVLLLLVFPGIATWLPAALR